MNHSASPGNAFKHQQMHPSINYGDIIPTERKILQSIQTMMPLVSSFASLSRLGTLLDTRKHELFLKLFSGRFRIPV
jgi:hypothetical protein